MGIKHISFNNLQTLRSHIKKHLPTFYYSSKTSTVIPYEKIEKLLDTNDDNFYLANLNSLPQNLTLGKDGTLLVEGPVTWKEAREYCRSHNRDIQTAPTEDLATITGGVATSATGERCFAFGNLRNQIISVDFIDCNGVTHQLNSQKDLTANFVNSLLDIDENDHPFKDFKFPPLEAYQDSFSNYSHFKNAPFPRMEKEIDLMTGTEGQLGVVSHVKIQTIPFEPVKYFFILLPRWEVDYDPHFEILSRAQSFRGDILALEMADHNSFKYLDTKDHLGNLEDVLFVEIKESSFERVYNEFFCKLKKIPLDKVCEINEADFHHIRESIPRSIFEENQRMGTTKKGTDVQVRIDRFPELLNYYREGTKLGIEYNLFGHFGDAHLHFNFMPEPHEINTCTYYLTDLYRLINNWQGSPFAEHGIGLLKLPFIRNFYDKVHLEVFKWLKETLDPYNQFFPQGFLNIKH